MEHTLLRLGVWLLLVEIVAIVVLVSAALSLNKQFRLKSLCSVVTALILTIGLFGTFLAQLLED